VAAVVRVERHIYKNTRRNARLRKEIMSKSLIALIILVLLGSLFIAGVTTSMATENKPADATTTSSATKTVTVTTDACVVTGNMVGVAKCQDFTIRLLSHPRLGCRWQECYDSTYVSLVNKSFENDPSSGTIGASGYDVFTFNALKEGTTIIKFDYTCPAERVVNSTTYTIIIK
jgi:predicted secreted protein